jgi:DNA-binding transcriptional ArsR family regulator
VARPERSVSPTGLKVLGALGKHGWASERQLQRVEAGNVSPQEVRKALEELYRAGLVSLSFNRNILTASGRRELQAIRDARRRDRIREGTARPHELALLGDAEVRAAVRRLKQRADRETDQERLTATFVDPGISEQLDNVNNQIIFGRRGTGKTHVLRVVDDLLSALPRTLVVYLDLRTLGSSSIFEDENRALHVRTTSLMKDVFEPVHAALLERATAPDAGDIDFAPLDDLADAISRSILVGERREAEEMQAAARRDRGAVAVRAAPPFVSLTADAAVEGRFTSRVRREGNPLDHVLFNEIARALERSLTAIGVDHLYVLLDEWTAIPEALQPYLAEFLKRSMFVVPEITVKIAALEYRSSFSMPIGRNNLVGFELGADISSSLELDDYFVYDRHTAQTEQVFAEVLFRHLVAEIGGLRRRQEKNYLDAEYGIDSADRLVDALFVSKRPYRELVRAGEGVARDFIGIFSAAFSDSVRRNLRAIDLASVREAARAWFATDKEVNLDPRHRAALDVICDEVIAKGRRRTFMLDRRFESNELLNSLVDFRLLHLIHRNVLDAQSPTRRYNLYTLDYGLYVDLHDAKYQFKAEFGKERRSSADVVPLDTRRYFRGVILSPEQFDTVSP